MLKQTFIIVKANIYINQANISITGNTLPLVEQTIKSG